MMLEKYIPNRLPGENLVLFTRSHWFMPVMQYLLVGLVALIPIGIYFIILNLYPDLLWGHISYPALVLSASVFYLFVLLLFYNIFIDFYLDVWIITNQRIVGIEQKGLFNREIYEHSLENVQEVSGTQKGMLATFFNYGNVLIQTASERPQASFEGIAKPFEVAQQIQRLIEAHKKV